MNRDLLDLNKLSAELDWFLAYLISPAEYKCFTDDFVGEASFMSNIMDGIIIIAIICLPNFLALSCPAASVAVHNEALHYGLTRTTSWEL